MNDDYPDEDHPWNFYFNGELMPKWGACWSMAGVAGHLQMERDADRDIGHRDVYVIGCQIDHLGAVESADSDIFIYAAQEVLHILLSQRDSILVSLKDEPHDVYAGLVETAFRMRDLAIRQSCAFWTSGYDADRIRLIEVMRRCRLPSNSPEFVLPPHVQRLKHELHLARERQIRRFHQLAQSGQFDKEIRKRLHEIRSL